MISAQAGTSNWLPVGGAAVLGFAGMATGSVCLTVDGADTALGCVKTVGSAPEALLSHEEVMAAIEVEFPEYRGPNLSKIERRANLARTALVLLAEETPGLTKAELASAAGFLRRDAANGFPESINAGNEAAIHEMDLRLSTELVAEAKAYIRDSMRGSPGPRAEPGAVMKARYEMHAPTAHRLATIAQRRSRAKDALMFPSLADHERALKESPAGMAPPIHYLNVSTEVGAGGLSPEEARRIELETRGNFQAVDVAIRALYTARLKDFTDQNMDNNEVEFWFDLYHLGHFLFQPDGLGSPLFEGFSLEQYAAFLARGPERFNQAKSEIREAPKAWSEDVSFGDAPVPVRYVGALYRAADLETDPGRKLAYEALAWTALSAQADYADAFTWGDALTGGLVLGCAAASYASSGLAYPLCGGALLKSSSDVLDTLDQMNVAAAAAQTGLSTSGEATDAINGHFRGLAFDATLGSFAGLKLLRKTLKDRSSRSRP